MTTLDLNHQKSTDTLGEETWDLYLAIERSFGVDLGDFGSLPGMRVSELAETIFTLAEYPTKEKCLSATVFYRLRQAFESRNAIPSRSIRPGTPLKQLLPWRSRKTKWRVMQEHLKLSFPGLGFPSWLALLCLITPAILLICTNARFGLALGWFKLSTYSLALALPTMLACIPLARSLPPDCETLEDLTKAVLAKNYGVFANQNCGSTKEDVLSALRVLVASETGLQVGKVLPETRIPLDLNIY